MNNNYIIKNQYSLDSYLEYKGKIPVFMSQRTVTYKMFQDFHTLLDLNLFDLNQDTEDENKVFIHYDEEIFNDGYSLDIRTDKTIVINAKTPRGVRYAINTLNSLVEIKDGIYKLPITLIEDEPSFEFRGIIEGYYGEPWSYQERLEMASFMDQYRLNTYMYAPKMDIYHREKWYQLYPDEEFKKLKTIKENLEMKDIDFYYCISPGHAKDIKDKFKYVGDEDFIRLFKKLDQFISIGVTNFGLLLDDIDYKLTGLNKEIFRRPGIAHAFICNKVNQYLKEKVTSHNLVMCPTEYHQIGSSEYRNDLKENLDKNIFVYWTGDNVCAEVITEKDVKTTKEAFGNDLFIWDNFPVSDFTYGVREFIAPLKNRTVKLSKYAKGYMINPSIHYHISKIGMISMAHYAWNSEKYDANKSFEIALRYLGEDISTKGRAYFNFNYPNVLSYGNLKEEEKWVKNKNYDQIKDYYKDVVESAKELLNYNNLFIEELSPWLKRVIKEEEIVLKIINETITKEELLLFFEDIKFSGSELLDNLIKDKNLLTEEEYKNLIKRRRGNPWYRVFENKRWPQK